MSSRERPLRRALREPLLHFAALATLIFVAHRALAPTTSPVDERVIELDDRYLEALVQREGRAGAEPDREAVAARWIRDEALAREARRLGLDRGDSILRRRLVQKMELWLEAEVELAEPSDAEVSAEVAAHPDRYGRPARVDFEHVFFGRERADPPADAREALARLRAGESAAALGDAFLLGRRADAQTTREIADRYGQTFADGVAEATEDRWTEPVESAYGTHLVRVLARAPAGAREDAQALARAHLTRQARAAAVRRAERALVARYRIVRGPAAP